jgi:hypothetical protein
MRAGYLFGIHLTPWQLRVKRPTVISDRSSSAAIQPPRITIARSASAAISSKADVDADRWLGQDQ